MKNVKNTDTNVRWNTLAVLLVAGTAALGATAASAAEARHGHVTPPPVPGNIEVEEGNVAFLVGHATGTQNYVCLPAGAGFAWSLFTPEATLFDDHLRQIITHDFGPNPVEGGTIRATWRDSRDTSTVFARAVAMSTDAEFVEAGAIPWVLLNVKDTGVQEGPRGGDRLTRTTFIHRLNTHGGSAPATGCSTAANVGARQFVPYTADYFFYEKEHGHDDDDDN
jgi:hypothetical protein